MQDILTYAAWLDAVCHICNSLLKANVTIFDNEFFKVVASKYRWVAFIDSESISHLYNVGFEPNVGAAELMKMIIYKWDELLVEEQD